MTTASEFAKGYQAAMRDVAERAIGGGWLTVAEWVADNLQDRPELVERVPRGVQHGARGEMNDDERAG